MQCKSFSLEIDAAYRTLTLHHRCVAGSNLTSRRDPSLPNNVAEFFSSRANLLLEVEMDSPSIATVQALVVMSATEAAFTRDARGWLYSGESFPTDKNDFGTH